jgi:integrase
MALVDGEWKRRSIFAARESDVARKLRAALSARDAGAQAISGKETVAGYLTTWLAGAESSVRPRTFASYSQIVGDHLVPHLGRIPLSRLQPHHVQALLQDLLTHRSAKTVRNVHGVLHRALEQAVRWRLLPTNVADLVDPPRVARQEMKALSSDEVRKVLDSAAADPLEALYRLAITSGMRQGELLALRWPQVDLDRGVIQVIATLEQRRNHAPVVAEPKTRRSRRQVQLAAATVESLRRHKTSAVEAALAAGRPYDLEGFVFRRLDERPLSMNKVYKAWTRLNARSGVQRVRFHDLRHTAATLLLEQGIHPKVVSEMLGHSTVSITLDVYSHVTPAMHREAARAMDEVLR